MLGFFEKQGKFLEVPNTTSTNSASDYWSEDRRSFVLERNNNTSQPILARAPAIVERQTIG